MIHVGETLVIIDDGTGGDVPEASAPAEEVKTEAAGEGEENEQGVIGEIEVSSAVMASSNEGMSAEPSQAQASTKALATPAARKLARDLGVDINTVTGSGAHGRVMKEDIIAASGSASTQTVAAPKVSISKEGNVEVVPITKLRKAIVSAMTRSKQIIPHTVLINELEVDELVELRQSLKPRIIC